MPYRQNSLCSLDTGAVVQSLQGLRGSEVTGRWRISDEKAYLDP